MSNDSISNPPMETEDSSASKGRKPKRAHQRARNNNSKHKNDDKFRAKVGAKVVEDYRAARNSKFTSSLPSDFSLLDLSRPISFASRPAVPVVKRVPFSTMGIGLAVSELMNRFPDSFVRSETTVHSLYRVSLAQLDLQRQVSAEGGVATYPVTRSLATEIPSSFRNALKAHPDNFKLLAYIIETYGKFRSNGAEYISHIPPGTERHPAFVSFSTLPGLIRWLSDPTGPILPRQQFFQHNSLPGAIVDVEQWILTNPDDFWPNNYGGSDLRNDCIALMRLLENMKTKFEQVAARVTYSGIGKIGTLISTSDPGISIYYQRYIPPEPRPSGSKRARVIEDVLTPART